MPKTAIYWMRNDLRLHDNECLYQALQQSDVVIPVYVFDPRQYVILPLGFRKTGLLRFEFLVNCLNDLRSRYQAHGSDILLATGNPEEILPSLVAQIGAANLYYQIEPTSEELAVAQAIESALKNTDCAVNALWGLTLYHPDDAPFLPQDTPLTSRAFRIQLDKQSSVRACYPTPTQIPNWFSLGLEAGQVATAAEMGFDSAETQQPRKMAYAGGETAALARLQYYTFETELLTRYKFTRNQSLGADYSSKFSPYLALGCLSPRLIYFTVKEYEKTIKRNKGTWWLIFEVVWRDYFKFLTLRFGTHIFFKGGIKNRKVNWQYDRELFERWCLGNTGIPFVDAHLRELNHTGFMSNRGRVNCASFLTRDYEIDWRWGAAWFESQLLDYDTSSNWLNWNTQATEIWYTNPVHQSGHKYDKEGVYIRSQIAELAQVPAPWVHIPWRMDETLRAHYQADAYPKPVSEPKKWRRAIDLLLKNLPASALDIDKK